MTTIGTTALAVLDQLDERYGHDPYYVLGKIEAEARDDLCGRLATPTQRLTRIVALIEAWDRADHAHRSEKSP